MAETTNTTKPAGSSARGGASRGGSSYGGSRGGAAGAGARPGGSRPGGRRPFTERAKPEYDQKILAIRRVTRVVSGGRRMTFSVALAIGDRKGMVGLGTGKAIDTSMAIQKAQKAAKKNMLKLKLTKTQSLPHDISAKFSSARVMLMPNRGRGLISGSATRDMLLLAGVKDVTTKILSGSKNKLNNARATMKAFEAIGTKVIHHKIASDRAEAAAATVKLAEESAVVAK
ncbi:MAG: 30S ribosomal protein S5 [bacterium]